MIVNIRDKAKDHVLTNGLKRNPIHCANRFVKVTGIDEIEKITTEVIQDFREKAKAKRMSIWTIEKTVTDVITLCKLEGVTVLPGRRLKKPRPVPTPSEIDRIGLVFEKSEPWMRAVIVMTYWTGMRIADAIRYVKAIAAKDKQDRGLVLTHTASKTGHCHQYPTTKWIVAILQAVEETPIQNNVDWNKLLVRKALSEKCEESGITPILPKHIRQRGLTEWGRANGMAGRIIHGCGLGVLDHYLDPLQILESAAPRVRIPNQFRMGIPEEAMTEESLLNAFRRLDESARLLIHGTAERLATT